ncbi:MAG: lysophospholipase [Oculatellaceae cyanobacterium Prado106]|nr:lysophospholipase [Oculatellaceae cyanobacterium Prado106]
MSAVLIAHEKSSPFLSRGVQMIGQLLPRLPTIKLNDAAISRDSEIVRRYQADPLVYHGRFPARTLACILGAIDEIQARAGELDLPLLVLHGTGDRLTNPEGSRRFYAKAGSQDKTLNLYDGFYHELLNEPERMQVLSDIESWLREHLH